MVKKLTKTGNSVAIVLDRALLEETGLTAESEVDIRTEGNAIIITRTVEDPDRRAKFRAAMNRVNDRYADVLRRLAK